MDQTVGISWYVTPSGLLTVAKLKYQDRVNAYFDNAAQPFLCLLGLPSSLNDFYRAYSLVSSRAFLVDAYHGLSLVPVADA